MDMYKLHWRQLTGEGTTLDIVESSPSFKNIYALWLLTLLTTLYGDRGYPLEATHYVGGQPVRISSMVY